MDKKVFINGKIIREKDVLEGYALIISKKIEKIVKKEKLDLEDSMEVIDLKGKYIAPGFIDIHIHGAGGSDTMDGSIEDLEIISKTIASVGVTAFLPTTMTMDRESIYKALKIVREGMKREMSGAQILGAHMEGPFISKAYKGAQNPTFIIKPSYDFIKNYLDVIKIITLAPEEDDNFTFIKKMKDIEDIVLSMGHTNSSFEEAMEAVEAGISHVTHLFNAMTPMHHRKPGAVGAALQSEVTCELIADTIHVHPSLLEFVMKVKGLEKVILVTDSMRAGCLKEGNYDLGGQRVKVDKSSARLEDGTLAGSILTLNEALKNVMTYTSISLPEAVGLLTMNPAKRLHIQDKKGSIASHKDADLCILDESYNVVSTIVQGNIIYTNEGE